MTAALDITKLFRVIDNKDAAGYCEFLSPQCILKFGNANEVVGKDNILDTINNFFHAIKALHHQVEASWEVDNTVICHGTVTYTRLDDTTLTVPVANIFTLDEGLIGHYRIFIDTSALF